MVLMTTYWEETTSLLPGLTTDTVPTGVMPLAQTHPTVRSHIPGRDDPHRPDPRRHAHRPDPRHDSHRPNTRQERHRPDPRRLDRRPDHRRTEVLWSGRTEVLHEPVTERLALYEPVTERLVRRDVAVLDNI